VTSLSTLVSRVALCVGAALLLGLPSAHADGRHGGPGYAARPGQWFDGAHGHRHYYPVTGWRVAAVPSHAYWVPWHGVRYGYWNGVWYAPYAGAYVVARPPLGIVVAGLPAFATAVTIGGIGYYYANGVYYRDHADGNYEVVPSPVVVSTNRDGGAMRTFVYPRQGQSAEKQASDEYECHRWAVDQTGFDPSAVAAGQTVATMPRTDYGRAQVACLEGRGYTVR